MDKLKAAMEPVIKWARGHRAITLAGTSFLVTVLAQVLPGVPLEPLTNLVHLILGA
jgi:hypothetical protein